ELRFLGNDVDLIMRVDGRKWINDDGKKNMPGGEVYTAPIEDSVEGYILFSYPAIWRGVEVEGVKLVFKRGVVVESSATRGEQFLKKIINVDEGSKRVGEIAFGLNYGISNFTKQILLDEKMGGTIHLALGSAYSTTGGINKSAIHWDLIKDMRSSKVFADGDLIYLDGRFLSDVI
ncbi:MAG: aminopeptidase, partial [Sulfolobales archaeon]